MDFAEVEFLAEDQTVEIIPNFTTKKPIELFANLLGPFEAGLVVTVPLWVAIFMKQRHRCKIVPPQWMCPEELEKIKAEETVDKYFTRLPNVHMVELTLLILQHAPNDVPDGDTVKTLIRDILDVRLAKLRSSMDLFIKNDQTHAQVDHLTPLEICRTRPLLISSLKHLRKLQRNFSAINEQYLLDNSESQ